MESLDLVARQRHVPASKAAGSSDGTAVSGLNEWRRLPQLRQRAVYLLCEFYRRENSPGSSLTDDFRHSASAASGTNHFDLQIECVNARNFACNDRLDRKQSTLLPDVLSSLRRLVAFGSEAHDSGSESEINLKIAGVAKACLADAEVGRGFSSKLEVSDVLDVTSMHRRGFTGMFAIGVRGFNLISYGLSLSVSPSLTLSLGAPNVSHMRV